MKNDYGVQIFQDIECQKNNIYVVLAELRKVVPQHVHTQGHILVVLEGVATMNVEHSAYFIPNGYFVWIPSQVSHRIAFEGEKVKVLNIYYPPAYSTREFYQEVGMYPIPSLLYHTVELFQERSESFQADTWRYELLSTIHRTLPHVIKRQKYQLRLPTSDHPVIQKIVEAIHRQYQDPITTQSISEEVGLSVRTLSRYLRSELHVSFVQYVRTYRIIMAINKMVKADDSITNIAYSVGYESLTAFSNSFYKETGQRPSLFLKQE